jgi:hypothetical protein
LLSSAIEGMKGKEEGMLPIPLNCVGNMGLIGMRRISRVQ